MASSRRSATLPASLFAAVLALLTARSVAADALFAAPYLSFDVGTGPTSVAIADLNADGRPDLAVANEYSNTVSVLLGHGDGSFLKTDFGTGSRPYSVAIADLNADGRPDLAVANSNSSTVSVLLGHGDGSFGPKTDFGTGTRPKSVAIADLDADGRSDLAVANSASNTVSVLLGSGDGSFGVKTDFGTGSSPWCVAIADLNADGWPDLAVANIASGYNGNRGTVSVLLGNGDGSFAPKTDFGTASEPSFVAIADLNADGRPDLAVANEYSRTVSVLLGHGDGSFAPKTDFGTGGHPMSVAIADLNADGRPDLAVANAFPTVSVLLGHGDGSFAPKTDFGTGSRPLSVTIADLDADGRPDLAVANQESGTVSVLLGNGDGSFGPNTDFGTGDGPSCVAIADLNADGRPDLAVANSRTYSSGTVSVLLGNGDGSFGPNTDFGTGDGPSSVAIADLNADGRPDLAVANEYSYTVSVLLGNGDGSFGPKTDFGTRTEPSSVAIADLNADARPDLVVANSGNFITYDNRVSVLLGRGDGSFGPRTDFGTGSYPRSVAIADLDGDSRLDLAVANNYSSTVSVRFGRGDGSFGPISSFDTNRPWSVAIADLNADGRPDLAVANGNPYYAGTVSVLLGNSNYSFGPKTDFAAGIDPVSVAIADLDADGRLDLAVANSGSNTVSMLLGHGDGSFAPKTDFGTGSHPMSVAIADLDADGRLDLAVANSHSNTVSVLLGTGYRPTATLLTHFQAVWTLEGLEVRWQLGAPERVVSAELERAEATTGPWTAVRAARHDEGEATIVLDRGVEPGRAYFYRLVVETMEGGTMTLGPFAATASQPADEFALLAVAPSPSQGVARIDFTVGREARVRLGVVDVQGRRVALLAEGTHRPGRYQVLWDGTTQDGPVPAGLYFIRLEAPGRSLVRRLVLAR